MSQIVESPPRAAQLTGTLPAPLALVEDLNDPFGCIGPEIPRLELEAGVRYKLRALLAMMPGGSRRRPREAMAGGDADDDAPSGKRAEHAAWQILHGVVLSSADGCGLRDRVRRAEAKAVRAAVEADCRDDEAVAELAKKCKALSLLAERYGGPYTAAEVAAMGSIPVASLPTRGPPGCKYYRVPFELALNAVGNVDEQHAFLRDGYAYVVASDMPDVLAAVSEEMAVAVEAAGDDARLGDAFVAAATGRAPELPYHHDASAMWLALSAATREERLALGVDAQAALRNAPACVHAFLYSCHVGGRLPHAQRVEALRCLIDCGFEPHAVAELLQAHMSDAAREKCSARDIAALRSYARNDGPKSSRCSVLQREWAEASGAFPHACPYPSMLSSIPRVHETPEQAGARREMVTGFVAWMSERSAAVDVEDLVRAGTPLSACRHHAAKLVGAARTADANALRITAPSDFLKFVHAGSQ
jgi:hypothetical protein